MTSSPTPPALPAFRLTAHGTRALLLHSGRLADPLDPATKALKTVTSKRVKTDEDHAEMARLEWIGSLYYDPDIGPYMPAMNIRATLIEAARKRKLGKQFEIGLDITTGINPIAYHGPRGLDDLWADENYRLTVGAKLSGRRVQRTRPRFAHWSVDVEGTFDPELIDYTTVGEVADIAGRMIGLGDWRPFFGRFTSKVERI